MSQKVFQLVIGLSALSPLLAHANDEGVVYTVGQFDTSRWPSACGNSSSSDFSYYNSVANTYIHWWNTWGWDRAGKFRDFQVYFANLADQSRDSDGADHNIWGADSYDVSVVYSHGSALCLNIWTGFYFSAFATGNSYQTCRITFGNPASSWYANAYWGNTDLEWMIVDACNSIEPCVHEQGGNFGGYLTMNAPGLSGILGFKGCSYDSSEHTQNTEAFVTSSRYNGMGDNWIDEMTEVYPASPETNEPIKYECPSAIVYGEDEAEQDYIYSWAGFEDRKNPSSHLSNSIYHIQDCVPVTQ